MDQKTYETIIEVLTAEIRRLKTDLYFKELEAQNYKAELEAKWEPLKREAENG